jgi:hypothetical protein
MSISTICGLFFFSKPKNLPLCQVFAIPFPPIPFKNLALSNIFNNLENVSNLKIVLTVKMGERVFIQELSFE